MHVLIIDTRRAFEPNLIRSLRKDRTRTVDIATVESTALAMCETGAYDVVVIVHDAESFSWTHVCAEVRHRLPTCRVLVLGAERPKVTSESEWIRHLALPLDPDEFVARLHEPHGQP